MYSGKRPHVFGQKTGKVFVLALPSCPSVSRISQPFPFGVPPAPLFCLRQVFRMRQFRKKLRHVKWEPCAIHHCRRLLRSIGRILLLLLRTARRADFPLRATALFHQKCHLDFLVSLPTFASSPSRMLLRRFPCARRSRA